MANKENLFNEISSQSKRASNQTDEYTINKDSGANITAKGDGSTAMVSGIYAQYKADKNSGIIRAGKRDFTVCHCCISKTAF